mgnify:FL=1
MRTIKIFATTLLFTAFVIAGCQKNAKELTGTDSNPVEKQVNQNGPCNSNAYQVLLESKTFSNGNWVWIWSVKNPNPGNGTNGTSQDLSHWGMQFGTCFNWADVVSAAYSSNGNSWVSFNPSYSVDPSQSCLTTPVLKFDFGTSGSNKSYYRLVLSRDYVVNQSAIAYYKSGRRMPCCTFSFSGVGCNNTIPTRQAQVLAN